jgi:catechol 2,3-dioxygenase-like lactoylglutathione lyase family enzyme
MSHLIPWRLGYVALDVADLDEAVDFWTRFGGLVVSERSGDAVHLRGGTDHHWIVLHPATGRPGLRRMAFELGAYADLQRYAERLEEEKIDFTRHDGEWSGPAIRFHDPSGYEIELVTGLGHVPNVQAGWFTPKELLHAVVAVTDLEESYDFYTRVLGFRESDRVIGRTVFLRGGIGYHHALVLGGGRGEPHLDHVCFLMPDLDDLMRARAFHLENGGELDRDLLRHPTSGSMGFYAKAVPAPATLEYCVDHARITDPDYRPRALTAGRWTSNVWLPPKR